MPKEVTVTSSAQFPSGQDLKPPLKSSFKLSKVSSRVNEGRLATGRLAIDIGSRHFTFWASTVVHFEVGTLLSSKLLANYDVFASFSASTFQWTAFPSLLVVVNNRFIFCAEIKFKGKLTKMCRQLRKLDHHREQSLKKLSCSNKHWHFMFGQAHVSPSVQVVLWVGGSTQLRFG